MRNKPLPPEENGSISNRHGNSLHASPQGTPNGIPRGESPFVPSQPLIGGLALPGSNGGPGTPTRSGQLLAPSVIISPSAPVCTDYSSTFHVLKSQLRGLPYLPPVIFRELYLREALAYTTSWSCRNHAW